MARLTQLDDVLFPVKEHSLYVDYREENGRRPLRVPDKKAIVNEKTHRVVGVVGSDYRLVSNLQALEWAHECCVTVFPETKPNEWEVTATDAPSTGGHCFIDLNHNTTALDFSSVPAGDRPDIYGPFIRVTNSYNRLRALTFDIGFYRKICKNGMIVPELIISFKFDHSSRDIKETIKFEVDQSALVEQRSAFMKCFDALRACKVQRSDFEQLIFGVLLIQEPEEDPEPHPRLLHEWQILKDHISELSDRYAREIGENAYSVFNSVTEFATTPPANRWARRERHSLQRLAGAWLVDFSKLCSAPGFDVSAYLEQPSDSGSMPEAMGGGNPYANRASSL
jgi:hypothetical protein